MPFALLYSISNYLSCILVNLFQWTRLDVEMLYIWHCSPSYFALIIIFYIEVDHCLISLNLFIRPKQGTLHESLVLIMRCQVMVHSHYRNCWGISPNYSTADNRIIADSLIEVLLFTKNRWSFSIVFNCLFK